MFAPRLHIRTSRLQDGGGKLLMVVVYDRTLMMDKTRLQPSKGRSKGRGNFVLRINYPENYSIHTRKARTRKFHRLLKMTMPPLWKGRYCRNVPLKEIKGPTRIRYPIAITLEVLAEKSIRPSCHSINVESQLSLCAPDSLIVFCVCTLN